MVHVTIDPRGVGRQKQILLGFSASLTTTNRTNPVPGRFPFPGPPGFPETATDRGQLLVDLAGNVHDYRGNEHLPFLLGPVGQLPIEPLPAHGQTKWKDRRTTTISILRRDEGGPPGMPRFIRPRMPRGPFGQPFGPPGIPGFPGLPGFAEPDEKPVAVVPALETATYQIVESSADGRSRE